MRLLPRRVELKTPAQVKQMRAAGLVVQRALAAAAAEVRPGVTTADLDAIAAEVIAGAGARPSFLGYGQVPGQPGFPGVLCVSVDDEIVHGVPGPRVLAEGELVSLDCGAAVDGWHADAALTVEVGTVSAERRALNAATRRAMWAGVAAAAAGGRVGDVSAAVEASVDREAAPYGIVEEYVGHGIGSTLHAEPDVPNVGRAGRGPRLRAGTCVAIEPMLTLGEPANRTLADAWTVVTDDGSPAAHWEHTVAIGENGLWVLTAADGGAAMLAELGAPYAPLAD